MKKKGGAGRIFAIVFLLFAVCVFALFASGAKISFIENYSYNFKMNILALTRHFGIELSEPVQEFLQDLSTPEPAAAEDVVAEPEADSVSEKDTEQEKPAVSAVPDVELTEPESGNKDTENHPVALEDASSAEYGSYRGYFLCVSETAVMAFDTDAQSLWAVGIHMSNPILRISGNYYMIAERGGRKIMAFDGKRLLFEAEADGNIKSASISSNGDIAVVSEKEYYKGAVIVINKNGDRIFSWNSGSDAVIDADISSGTRRLAISLLNTENGALSRVLLFDISKTDSYAQLEFSGSVVFDVKFLGGVLNVFADDKICGVSQKGKILWESDYTERKLLHYRTDDSGYKLIMSDNSNVPELEVLNARGKRRALIAAETMPEYMDIGHGMIAYNSGRELKFGTVSAKREKVHVCTRDIRDIYIIDSNNAVVVYNSGLDFIKFT